MIPVRLELTNFLAYRNPAPLDFTGIHVAVLVGENGAGKSSLLDAITWALWGRARAKTDAELVHQGQSEMRVEFTFALGGQTYRVIRAKRVGRAAAGLLDLQAQEASGQWAPLGEATIPKTQEKISRLLRLTYETFINSAYLMQGKADEFTARPPNKRKEVLADILGLQAWETYEARARERLRALDQQLAGLAAVLADMELELGQREAYLRELAEMQARVIEVGERLRQAEAGWVELERARQSMIALERQAQEISLRLADAERELTGLDDELRQAQARADQAALARQVEAVRERLARLEALEAQQAERTAERQQVAEAAAQLRGQNEALEVEANGLKKRLEAAGQDAERERRRLAEAAQAETGRLRQRIATLQTATDPRCPICGQALTEAARAQLLLDLQAEMSAREARLQQDLADFEQARAAGAGELAEAVEARRAQYRDNQARLKKLVETQAGLERGLRQLADDLRQKPDELRALAEAQTALGQADAARERIALLQARRQTWEQSLAEARARRAGLEREADTYEAILRDSAAKQRALDQLRQEDALAKARLGAAQQKLAALDGLARQQAVRRAEHARLAELHGRLEELRDACGRRGVPAMMIEAAVPEIETQANRLLGRMTAGRMHVRFNTQRETQGGEVRETLDIQISDELGTRAYELYSGGEAFRVNFAIRLALSQLLARRAGTQLQTLIVDEGFGVLDATGRERLVEAINAAQDDFQRILVVTHIDELKDAFPARIEITKGPNGSQIAVA